MSEINKTYVKQKKLLLFTKSTDYSYVYVNVI